EGRFGKMPVEEMLRILGQTQGGPEVQVLYQTLALRKKEALPFVLEKLRTGSMSEKRMLTKFLGLCAWPEAKGVLLEMASNASEHWLPRQGALYALGALGDAAAGPVALAVLKSDAAGINLQMAAISTISRTGYKEALPALAPFEASENIHLRLFASRARADLGGAMDTPFLLKALQHPDYVARQEASEALWRADGDEVTRALQTVATGDQNEAVRDSAMQSLLRREIAGRTPAEKVEILNRSMEQAGRLTSLWILRTILEEAGASGRGFVEKMTTRNDFLGEHSRAYLVLAMARTE
ncbi:MAG TPA: HEAT repeat domain-containing protein, partial [Candidatus Saccharimonadales bacterium]|nr:HEAT repeat domain-containing protein [Candidatus Saccharimonadales bacterium]